MHDFWPGDKDGNARNPMLFDGEIMMSACDEAHGCELYSIDPNANLESTGKARLITDLCKGPCGSNPRDLVVLERLTGDLLFLTAEHEPGNRELYAYDHKDGLRLVKDINPGSSGSYPERLTVAGDRLFFFAETQQNGRELWMSDGTRDGTVLVKDIRAGATGSTGELNELVAPGGSRYVVFTAQSAFGSAAELWVSDGTAAGTVKATALLQSRSLRDPRHLRRVGNELYMTGRWDTRGFELFKVDVRKLGIAYANTYGGGCRGTSDVVAKIGTVGDSWVGNSAFGIKLERARPNSGAMLYWSPSRGRTTFGACTLWLAPFFLGQFFLPTDGDGKARMAFPIPSDTRLSGIESYFQWVVFDTGSRNGLFAVSSALAARLGKK